MGGWQSSNQLPFLVTNSSNYGQPMEPATSMLNKKKPQIYIQKTQTSTASNTHKPHFNTVMRR